MRCASHSLPPTACRRLCPTLQLAMSRALGHRLLSRYGVSHRPSGECGLFMYMRSQRACCCTRISQPVAVVNLPGVSKGVSAFDSWAESWLSAACPGPGCCEALHGCAASLFGPPVP